MLLFVCVWRLPVRACGLAVTSRFLWLAPYTNEILDVDTSKSSRPRDNLTRTERAALKSLELNTNLTILPADKGNVTVILNTTDYKQKIASHLEDPAYRNTHFTPLPMKMELTEGSETSAYINQTPGNYPKGNLLYSVHGESLKSRRQYIVCITQNRGAFT